VQSDREGRRLGRMGQNERSYPTGVAVTSYKVVFVGFPEMGVNVSTGNFNFNEDAMVQNVDKINTRGTATSSIDD
jgi:hypothetical protein